MRQRSASSGIMNGTLGWSHAYAKGVLNAWKARESYCRAVLTYSRRIGLDGSLTEGVVDDNARAMATARLEQIAARKVKEAAPPDEPPRPRRLLVASSAEQGRAGWTKPVL